MSTGSEDGRKLSFYERVIQPQKDADAYIAQVGGEPEVTGAAQGIMEILRLTREGIKEADFASRFAATPNDYLRDRVEANGLSFHAKLAIEEEGERGLKRQELLAAAGRVGREFDTAMLHLIQLRADLVISQTEF